MTLLSKVLPWRVQTLLRRRWPKLNQRIRYGTWNVNTKSHWDEGWATYDGHYCWNAPGYGLSQELIRKHVQPGSRVLDCGCGAGELLMRIRDCTGVVGCGLDISAVGVEKTKEAGFDAVVSELPAVPFPGESFDVVTMTDTLEHVSDARATIREVARILALQGVVMIEVPDGRYDDVEVHVHRFTKGSLERLLSRHFEVTIAYREGGIGPALLVAVGVRKPGRIERPFGVDEKVYQPQLR